MKSVRAIGGASGAGAADKRDLLMKMKGLPVVSDWAIASATFGQCTSPAAPPPTVKSTEPDHFTF